MTVPDYAACSLDHEPTARLTPLDEGYWEQVETGSALSMYRNRIRHEKRKNR